MGEELSTGWSLFVVVITLASIFGCVWLIAWTSMRRDDEPAETETTNHVWDDDLQELNQPLPFWWVGLFIVTIIFSLIYLVTYPGLGNYGGLFSWSQQRQHQHQVNRAEYQFETKLAEFGDMDIGQLAQQPDAVDIGRKLYQNWCTGCHGSDARGATGYPNLSDNDWLYGNDPQQVLTSIAKGRAGMMPPMGQALGAEGVAAVTAFLQNPQSSDAKISQGKDLFASSCAACHGADGRGNTALGAPNLMDDIWLYGGDSGSIMTTISKGRQNARMPAHEELISHEKLRLLTAYILSLSQNEQRQ